MADYDHRETRVLPADSAKGSSSQPERKAQWSRFSVTAPEVFNKAKSDMVTYEDLLVHRYLENLKRERRDNQQDRQILQSPYLQRLPNSHLTNGRYRPASATMQCSQLPSGKPKIDAKFIADSALWDPATPREVQFRRPTSAPVRRLRPHSAVSQRTKGSKPIYRKQPHVIKTLAYINGRRDKFIHAAAPNIKILLEYATEKLGLPFAARRIFAEDGVEILSEKDFPLEGDIYISMGEGFKDPYYAAKRNMVIRNGAVWNLKGVILPENGHKKGVKARLSKRIRALCENKKVRIMVYRNGQNTSAGEVVADLKNIQDFFMCCTARLNLRSCAKIAYDWDGNEITDLADTPVLDDSIIHQGKTPLLGPLWISTGEGFSPSGTQNFLLTVKHALKNKIKIAKQHKQNITFALDNEKEKVTDVAVLSLSVEELYQSSEKVDDELDKLKESVTHIKKKLEALQEDVLKEETQGMKYRLSHIQEISANNRLVGTRGCRLKVFENGKASGAFIYYFNIREALRGLEGTNSKEKLMQRLLDELSNTRFSEDASRNLKAVATTLYDKNGCEITDVLTLEQEQARQVENNVEQPEISVWMSFGEAYICPFSYALHLFLDKVTGLEEKGEHRIVTAPVSHEEEHLARDSSKLEAVMDFPSLHGVRADSNIKSYFLQHKEEQHFVLYPEIGVAEKFTCKNQLFAYTESGHIYCKAAPQLCLAVSDAKLKTRLLSKDIPVEGFAVCMQKKSLASPCQIWRCAPDATVYSEIHPTLLLTYLGNKRDADGCETGSGDYLAGHSTDCAATFLVVAEPLPNKVRSAQRFAFKQENFHNLGQWKKTEHSNPEWNKLAYSWPVRANGELNKEYDWPMEGFIIPYAPPIEKLGNKLGLSGITPVRLRVLKNFEPNMDLAISVVGPNVTNMLNNHTKKKDIHKKGKKHETTMDECENVDLHCMDMTVAELEFQMFLQNCTNLLNLPFAGRRLFNNHGKELFTIQNLEKDSLVYVSCGEDWAGTNVSRVEQRRRFLLSQLSSDVTKIQQYCSLRNPENYVLEVNGPLAPRSGLVVNKFWSRDTEPHHDGGELSTSMGNNEQPVSRNLDDQTEADFLLLDSDLLTAHDRAHLQSEERLNSLKWPWERLVNVANSMDMDDPEANKYTDRDLYEKFKPQTVTRISRDMLQKFEFAEEYLALMANQNLVLSVSETEGRVMGVVLAKRRPDDINQRFVIKENGEIRARHNQNMVLTVCMPTTATDECATLSFAGCPVTLQSRCVNTFGKAHQMWRYDAETGLIRAFQSDSYDKEITAANKADVCTYAIAQAADIDQPGYQVEIDNQKHKVCMSCARSMRGRYKVQRLPPNTNFHCAMGDAKKLKIRQVGSFRVLNNKVDLSTFEAHLSLRYWTDMLKNLKQQTSVHSIVKEINAVRSVLTVKVLAYKNGEGRLRRGEIICGSSIAGILGQCTLRLGMNTAARRLYLEDGSIVLDVDDLVKFAVESCKNDMINTIFLKQAGHDDNRVNVKEKDKELREHPQQHAASEDISQEHRRSSDIINSGDAGQEESPEKEKENVEETQMGKQERDKLLENIKLPPMEHILRAPVEVWVSSGKAFVPPDVVESKEENLRKKRQLRAQVCLALDIEKHILRQMKGRRFEQMSPGTYESTLSSQQPVVIEKHWQEQTVEEQDKNLSIDKLKSHLCEIRANQQEEKVTFAGINLEGKLYCQPNMKRVIAFPNGTSTERSVYVWGSTIEEILSCAVSKLSLSKEPKILYNMDGQKIEAFEDIQRDQLLCVSTLRPFMPPRSQRLNTEVKANWGRARKMYGQHATDLTVNVQKNPQVDVDPFGPPLLALSDGSSACLK